MIVSCVLSGLIGLWLAAPPQARADAWNQETIFTFNEPVEIPGQVLPAGTYVFKLANSDSDRNIVEVLNKDQNHMYGFFMAIPDYRLRPSGKPIITFEERAADAPPAVRAWFYPGDNYGHEFVYPKVRAMALAKANNQPVAFMPNELAANTTRPVRNMNEAHVMAVRKAPVKAVKPNQEEVAVAEVFTPPPQPAAAQMSNTLPKTASPLPLIGLIGLLSVAVAGLLRLVANRVN